MKSFQEYFSSNPIIGVLRGIDKSKLTDTIEAAVDGGLTCVEITMNTSGATDLIELASAYFKGTCCIGAGTVLTVEECRNALDAGANYVVSPNTGRDVIELCKSENVPVIAGALTPTEIFDSWKYGADMVKVFPVNLLGGPEYIKELRGPYADIPLVAFGGVTVDNVDDFFNAGVNGIGLGNKLFNPELIRNGNFGKIKESAESFTKIVSKRRKK